MAIKQRSFINITANHKRNTTYTIQIKNKNKKKNSRKLKGAEDWGDELPEIIFPEILINIFLKIPGQHPVFFFFLETVVEDAFPSSTLKK